MLKKILPVGIGLVLILVIALGVYGVKKGNDKTPTLSNADDVYMSYVDASNTYNVTYDRLYNQMKKSNGAATLINMIDKIIYKDALDALVVNEDVKEYAIEQIFGTKDEKSIAKNEEMMEKWNDLMTSFRISKVLTQAEAAANTLTNVEYFSKDAVKYTPYFNKVVDEYKLAFVRNEWAKQAAYEKYLEDNKTDAENPITNKTINDYYKNNYSQKVHAIVVPFQSQEEALAAMRNVGVNTLSSVRSTYGVWIKSSYDYYSKDKATDEDKFTLPEVIEAFCKMYNDAYHYQNKSITFEGSFEETLWEKQTLGEVVEEFSKYFKGLGYGTSFKLGEMTYTVKDKDGEETNLYAKVTTSLEDDVKKLLDEANGVYTPKLSSWVADKDNHKASRDIVVNYTVQMYEKVENGEDKLLEDLKKDSKVTITLKATNTGTTAKPVYVSSTAPEIKATSSVNAIYSWDFVNPTEEFIWDANKATAVNSTLATYVSASSTNLTVSEHYEDSKFYTVSPVSCGDYYYLVLKLQHEDFKDLYVTEDKELVENTKNEKFTETKQEIVNAILEGITTENNINDVIYQNRMDHNMKIYDKFMEAIYEYSYEYFYETTLGTTKYTEFTASKKNQSKYVASLTTTTGKAKKSNTVYITAEDLFKELENRYGASTFAQMVEAYIILADTKYNNVYNPFTQEELNKTGLIKDLLISETSYQQKYFEQNLFSKQYEYYYQYTGIVPNFPSSYGWSNFIRDYFCAYSDYEFLTSSAAGATIYNDAMEAYLADLIYDSAVRGQYINATYFDVDVPTIHDLMVKARDEFYGAGTCNLIVEFDHNYNGTTTDHEDLWTDYMVSVASDLADKFYELAEQVSGATLYDKLTSLVEMYKNAPLAKEAADCDDVYAPEFNYFGYVKYTYGFKVICQQYDYSADANYVSEYNDATKDLYFAIKDKAPSLLGQKLDKEVAGEAFKTVYGVHKIAATKTEELLDLPDETLISAYVAQKNYVAAKSSLDSAKESLKTNTDPTYTQIAEARVNVAQYEFDKAEAAFKAVVGDVDLEKYEIDEEATKLLAKWFDSALSSIRSSQLLSMAYYTRIYDFYNTGKLKGTEAQLQNLGNFLSVLKEECSHEHNH